MLSFCLRGIKILAGYDSDPVYGQKRVDLATFRAVPAST